MQRLAVTEGRRGLCLARVLFYQNPVAWQRRYEHSGWLRSIGVGAAVRHGRTVEWTGAVHTLQHQLYLPVHVGGHSVFALTTKDLRDIDTVYLWTRRGVRTPTWFTRNWGNSVRFKVSNFLPVDLGLTIWEQPGFPVRVAGPERAMLECISLVSRAPTQTA